MDNQGCGRKLFFKNDAALIPGLTHYKFKFFKTDKS
jgi:hypothetical protein